MVDKVSLNNSETSFMVFSKQKCEKITIKIDNCSAERVCTIKFLWVVIDFNLNWSRSKGLTLKWVTVLQSCII